MNVVGRVFIRDCGFVVQQYTAVRLQTLKDLFPKHLKNEFQYDVWSFGLRATASD